MNIIRISLLLLLLSAGAWADTVTLSRPMPGHEKGDTFTQDKTGLYISDKDGKTWFDASMVRKPNYFLPPIKEPYYYIDSVGVVQATTFEDTPADKALLEYGNYYTTLEEAEAARKK